MKFEINDSTVRDVSRKIYEAIKPQIFPEIKTVEIDGIVPQDRISYISITLLMNDPWQSQ